MKWVIIVIGFVGGGVVIYNGIDSLRCGNAVKSWPVTEGTVTSCKCVRYWSMDHGSSYLTHVDYSYVVAGRSYRCERIAFGYNGSCWV